MIVLPMFPLGSVLLPTTLLPLRLFEERYLALIRDVLEADRDFGVALIERGHEVGGGDARTNVGCVAQVLQAEDQGDMWHVIAVGTRRFVVDRWLDDDPYPRAEVTILEEPPAEPGDEEMYLSAVAKLETILALLGESGRQTAPIPDLADDPALGSFQVAALAPFGPFDRQQLLQALVPSDRLTLLHDLLDGTAEDLRSQLRLG